MRMTSKYQWWVLGMTIWTNLAYAVDMGYVGSPPSHIWLNKANSICTQLIDAARSYGQGDLAAAQATAQMANTNYVLEIAPRATPAIPTARIKEVEQGLNTFNNNMATNTPTIKQRQSLIAQAQILCLFIKGDAVTLDGENVPAM